MKGNNGVRFFTILFIIGILTYIAFNGLHVFGTYIPGAKDIRLGIDIKGGVSATLKGVNSDGSLAADKDLETAKVIIGNRLDAQGITDRNITIDKIDKRILIDIPWRADEKDYNPQKTIDDAVKPAVLTFREVDETKKDENGAYLPIDKIVLDGKNVADASVETNPSTGEIFVSLKLDKDGTKKFAEATARLVGKPIAIFMDDQYISAPKVNGPIPNGQAQISGSYTAKEAGKLAETIRSGSLPIKLVTIYVSSISPTLGDSALKVIIMAGAFALLLVWIFMLFYYRLPGILANIALLAHTTIQLLAISWLQLTNLTLPGIAGIILTIGMGVDANVIIFERIKEELRSGKTLRAAIDVGFKRAFTAVLDANMTTLISAVVLWYFGTGPIKGFAYTLGLGVILSFLTAVLVSRIMLKCVADTDIAKHHWLYGVKGVQK